MKHANKKATKRRPFYSNTGGEGGIRTHDPLSGTPVFKSRISRWRKNQRQQTRCQLAVPIESILMNTWRIGPVAMERQWT